MDPTTQGSRKVCKMELELRQFLPQIKYLPSNPRTLSRPSRPLILGLLELSMKFCFPLRLFQPAFQQKLPTSTQKRGTIYSLKSGSSIDKSIDVPANWQNTLLDGSTRDLELTSVKIEFALITLPLLRLVNYNTAKSVCIERAFGVPLHRCRQN